MGEGEEDEDWSVDGQSHLSEVVQEGAQRFCWESGDVT